MHDPKLTSCVALAIGLVISLAGGACSQDDGQQLGSRSGGANTSTGGENDDNEDSEPTGPMDTGAPMDAPPIEGPETTTEPVDTQKDMSEPPPRDMSQARDTFEGFEDTPDDSGSVPCWETGTTSNPSCREPTSCPAPDKSRKPQITCYTPHWTSEFEDFTLDIYGKHLVNENGPPEQVIYRDDQTTGPAGRTNDNIEVISDCHIRVTLYIRSSTILSCGRTLEFRLQREDVSLGEFDAGFRGNPSDWHTVRITK